MRIKYLACQADLGSSDLNPVFIKAVGFYNGNLATALSFCFFLCNSNVWKVLETVGPSETGSNTGRRRSI